METCPHCSAPTISRWRKANATSVRPARCSSCGGLSFIPGWYHALAAVLSEVSVWGSIVIALALHSWYPLLLLPLGLAAIFYFPAGGLRATDVSAVSRARLRFAIELAVIAVVVGVAYFLFGHNANAS